MGKKRKILIVDDNEDLCRNLLDILELKEYDVDIVYNGANAIGAVKNEKFDVVLLDVNMPGLSGIDTLKILKQIEPHLAIIMITAYADDIFYKEGLKSSDYEIIQKPIDIDKLFSLLENIAG